MGKTIQEELAALEENESPMHFLEEAASEEEMQKLTEKIRQPLELEEMLSNRSVEERKLHKQKWNAKKIEEILSKTKKPINRQFSNVSELTVALTESMLQDWFDLEGTPCSALASAKVNIAKELYKLIG